MKFTQTLVNLDLIYNWIDYDRQSHIPKIASNSSFNPLKTQATVNLILFKFNLQITDSAVSHDAIVAQSIPYNIFADFQYFWSKCVCVFNTIDTTMNDSKMDELWHNFRVQMTAIVNVEWTNCIKSTDTNQRRK